MKKILITMMVMTTLCLHSATQEEVRRIVREYVETSATYTHEKSERLRQLESELKTLDKDAVLPVYLEMLEERFDDPNPKYVDRIMIELGTVDGH